MATDDRKLSSAEWEKELGIQVMDPDGWDRTNLEEDWNRPISIQEFRERAMVSTIMDITPGGSLNLFPSKP